MVNFEKELDVYETIGDTEGIVIAKRDILLLQSQSTKVAAGIRRSYRDGITRVV